MYLELVGSFSRPVWVYAYLIDFFMQKINQKKLFV